MKKEDYERLERIFLGKETRDQAFLDRMTQEGIKAGEKPIVKSYPKEVKHTPEEMKKLQEEFARQFGPHPRE